MTYPTRSATNLVRGSQRRVGRRLRLSHLGERIANDCYIPAVLDSSEVKDRDVAHPYSGSHGKPLFNGDGIAVKRRLHLEGAGTDKSQQVSRLEIIDLPHRKEGVASELENITTVAGDYRGEPTE